MVERRRTAADPRTWALRLRVAVFALLDVTLVADHARTCKRWRDDVQGWAWDSMQVQ